MLVAIAFSVLGLTLLATLAGGIALTARQFAFLKQSYRVEGNVISESRYRHHGRMQRYYRVEFHLRNGQRAELRGSGWRPLGEPVSVLVREAPGQDPKAQIDDWSELWFAPAIMLGLGIMGSLLLAVIQQARPL